MIAKTIIQSATVFLIPYSPENRPDIQFGRLLIAETVPPSTALFIPKWPIATKIIPIIPKAISSTTTEIPSWSVYTSPRDPLLRNPSHSALNPGEYAPNVMLTIVSNRTHPPSSNITVEAVLLWVEAPKRSMMRRPSQETA